MGRAVLLLAFLVPLSGCLDSPPCATVPVMTVCEPCGPCGGHYPPEPATLRGVVVDAAIVPVPDALVEVVGTGLGTTTDEGGAFRLSDLGPGIHHLRVTHPLYDEVHVQVAVRAGDEPPPVVKVQLQRRVDADPYATQLLLSGFVFCSSSTAGLISEECGEGVGIPGVGRVGGHHDNRAQVDFHADDPYLRSVAADLSWEPTLTVGAGVQEGHVHAGLFTGFACEPVCRYDALVDDKRGASPLALRDGDGEQGGDLYFQGDRDLADLNVTAETRFSLFVWASDEQTGVLFEQPFEAVVTLAYVLPLPEGWRTGDGAPF